VIKLKEKRSSKKTGTPNAVDEEIDFLRKRREELFIQLSEITDKIIFLEKGKKSKTSKKYKDDTEYLLSNKANRNHLMKSIAQLNKGEHQIRELIEE
jgi:PHD/YefM family antitoxin component YafN of YafNO toxin-antitoxin module